MRNNETLAHEWYLVNVKPEELDKKVKATLEYVKRFNEPEDGEWVVWAHEITSGAHGQYTVRIFLDEVLNQGNEKYMNEDDLDVIMGTYDEVSSKLADDFNHATSLPGTFYLGHNEADGSLGVFYTERA
jgi:hypothetical protein